MNSLLKPPKLDSGSTIGLIAPSFPFPDEGHNDYYDWYLKEIVTETLRDFTFPILAEVDFGHESVNIPMLIGVNSKIDAGKLEFIQLEAGVA